MIDFNEVKNGAMVKKSYKVERFFALNQILNVYFSILFSEKDDKYVFKARNSLCV